MKKKSKTEKLEELCNKCEVDKNFYQQILGSLTIITIMALLVYGINYATSIHPSYKVGDCLLNRKFELVKVEEVHIKSFRYVLSYQKSLANWNNGWSLIKDDQYWLETYDQSLDSVDKSYTQIPCESKEY